MDLTEKKKLVTSRIQDTVISHLNINFTKLEPDEVIGTINISKIHHQTFGLLHGGVSVLLAETLASIGAWLNIDSDDLVAVGQEINANHLRPVSKGILTGVAKPIHVGKKTQVWEIKISSDQNKLVCISRCTIAVVAKN